MQKALEAVRAKRAGVSTPHALQPKPEHREAPALTAMDLSDLADIVEDEEATAPPAVKQQGFGIPGDACPPMKSLVQRRDAKPASQGLRKAMP
jgi:hypothetical protein